MDQELELARARAKAKLKLKEQQAPTPASTESETPIKDAAIKTAKAVGTVLDYIPGYTRTALQKGADVLTGGEAAGDFEQALMGEAQPWGEYLKKRGFEGGGATAAGIGLDILSDPTILATGVAKLPIMGATKAAALMKAATPLTVLEKASTASAPLAKMAELNAAKALGLERGTLNKLGLDKARLAGRQALDQKIITPLSNTEEMIARNTAAKQNAWKEMQSVLGNAGIPASVDPLQMAVEMENRTGKIWRTPINKPQLSQYENTLESMLSRGDAPISLNEAHELKKEIDQVAKWGKAKHLEVTPAEEIARDASKVVSDSIDAAIKRGAKSINKPSLLEHLDKARSQYGGAATAEKLLAQKQARELGNKTFGLTDWMTIGAGGGGALASHSPEAALLAIPALAGKKFTEKFGRNVTAIGLDKASKAAAAAAPLTRGAYKFGTALPPEVWAKMIGALPNEEENQ